MVHVLENCASALHLCTLLVILNLKRYQIMYTEVLEVKERQWVKFLDYVLKNKIIFKALSWDLPVLCPFDSLQPVYVVDRKLVNISILTKNLQCALC